MANASSSGSFPSGHHAGMPAPLPRNFVLTGHVRRMVPNPFSRSRRVFHLSIALNYQNRMTTFPVSGGAMTYVKCGKGWLMFLGFTGLPIEHILCRPSAVGFAISLPAQFLICPLYRSPLLPPSSSSDAHPRVIQRWQSADSVKLFPADCFGIFIYRASAKAASMETFLGAPDF